MSVVSITAWVCDFPQCGHVWYAAKEPKRCAKCKKANWNKLGGEVVRPPKTRKKAKSGAARARTLGMRTIAVAREEGALEPKPASEVESITVANSGPPVDLSTASGWEKTWPVFDNPGNMPGFEIQIAQPQIEPVKPEPILETVVNRPTADKYREILAKLAAPTHKVGEKCPHGWANWMQCAKCNQKVNQ